ncbi:MAG: Na(+)-translocating NADH-quinone reductase subunit F [Flavobacteriales bacterium]|jgi:hypothetical protein|nr:Na(+)-translocating NADH-quinone reductase subunit F [Flavobacteriales bacterium]
MKYTPQELHQIAMTTVGKKLEKKGFEFLAINSTYGKNPQFVCQKDRKLSFVLVKHVLYPANPDEFNTIWMEAMKQHAKDKEARLYYAGVGIANDSDLEEYPEKDQDVLIKFSGNIKRIL